MSLSMRPGAQRGVSLIEVIITMAIIAIAVTGIFGVQSGAMRGGNEMRLRSSAIEIAEDMLAHMRSNRFQLASYNGTTASPPGAPNRVRWDYEHLRARLDWYFANRSPEVTISVDGNDFVVLSLDWNAGVDSSGNAKRANYTITAQM